MICDLHTHSEFSFDGEVPVDAMCEAAIAAGVEHLAITDHCDVDSDVEHWQKIFDRDAAWEAMTAAKEKYAGRLHLHCGIELGNPHHYPEYAREVLASHPYEWIIGSLHNLSGVPDFCCFKYEWIPVRQCHILFDKALDESVEIVRFGGINTLAHLTYMYRYLAIAGISFDFEPHMDKIRNLFKAVVAADIALEVNVSTLWRKLGFTMPHRELLDVYRECGGRKISLGSDSHSVEHVGECIEEGMTMASELGLTVVLPD